jgi:hypothetical protein
MPIVSTVEVSQEIVSLKFFADDTLVVELQRTENGFCTQQLFTLDSATVRGLLDTAPLEGLTLRQTIVASIYQVLIAQGLVVGEITQ